MPHAKEAPKDVKRDARKGSVTVTLAGQRFAIRSDHPEQRLHDLAAYVDRQVAELRAVSPAVATHQLALLAAMNIADELFNAEARQREFKTRVARKGETLLRAVEDALQQRATLVRESTVPVTVTTGGPAPRARDAKG
jgi:cell division protein ZapA